MIRLPKRFRELGFDAIELDPTITDDDGQSRRESLRLLIVTDLENLIHEAIEIARWHADHGTPENQKFFDFCIQMLPYVGACDKIDPVNERRFDAKSFNHSPDFREMMRMTNSRHLPQSERLKRFVTDDHRFDQNSFEEARYQTPEIIMPFDEARYVAFRDNLLDEMVGVRAELEKSATDTVRAEAHGWLRDPKAPKRSKKKAKEILDAEDVFEVCPELYDAWDEIEQMLMKTALRIEAERTLPFEHLLRPASQILADVTELSASENSQNDDPVEISDEQLHRFLDVDSAVEVVQRIIDVESDHPESMGDQAQKLMIEAVQSKAPDELWEALEWFCENMVNRNECIRLLAREAEWVLHILLELALIERYIEIRPELSRAERRLFHFMYRRSPWFNGRIPALDQIGTGFLFGLDDEHASLVIGVAGYRGDADQTNELETRWKAFIGLYPFWLELLRSQDTERKSRRKSETMTPEIEDDLGCDDPRDLIDMHLPRELVDASIESVQILAEQYCSATQRPIIVGRFVDRKTQDELAIEFGVSQQAISRTLKSGLDQIRNGLFQDQKVESANEHQRSA